MENKTLITFIHENNKEFTFTICFKDKINYYYSFQVLIGKKLNFDPRFIKIFLTHSDYESFKYVESDEKFPEIAPQSVYAILDLPSLFQNIQEKEHITQDLVKSCSSLKEIEIKYIQPNISFNYNGYDEYSFLDREDSIEQIIILISNLYKSFKDGMEERIHHPFLSCITGSGMGKSTFGFCCSKFITKHKYQDESLNDIMKECIFISIDFNSGGDALTAEDLNHLDEIVLCKRLFSRSVLGLSFSDSKLNKLNENENKLFNLNDTLQYIASKNRTDKTKPLAIFIHIDEFQMAHQDAKAFGGHQYDNFVKKMIEALGSFKCTGNKIKKSNAHNNNIFIIPFLTGTNSDSLEIVLSKWEIENINIKPLSYESSKLKIINNVKYFPQLDNYFFKIMVMDLGIVPRYLEYLIFDLNDHFNSIKQREHVVSCSSDALIDITNESVSIQMVSKFGFSLIKRIQRMRTGGFNDETLETLLYYCICGVDVTWDTIICGKSIKELSYSGHIITQNSKGNGNFKIILPVIDLNTIATKLNLFEFQTITQFPLSEKLTGFKFEYITAVILMLKINCTFNVKKSHGPLTLIFGNHIEKESDNCQKVLNSVVRFKKMKLVYEIEKWINIVNKKINIVKGKIKGNETVEIIETDYVSLLCSGCVSFDIRLNFDLEKPFKDENDILKNKIMIAINTKFTTSGKYLSEADVKGIHSTYRELKLSFPSFIIIPIIISNYKVRESQFPAYKEILIYHQLNINSFFSNSILHRVDTKKLNEINDELENLKIQ
ncbi:hypothetical protein ACTFIW_011811 [Dictyostelium discoideum]